MSDKAGEDESFLLKNDLENKTKLFFSKFETK